MNKLLSRDSVKSRLVVNKADPDGGLSFTEFSYQIFQSYDWLHLNREHECSIQLGGSDQVNLRETWNNILATFFLINIFCIFVTL